MSDIKHFGASNSGKGFKSYFDEIFGAADRLYIIKGGPGVGKSSLMKRLAAEGEKNGVRIRKIYCSSDPASLDGVIFEGEGESVAIVDGTAPHIMEPSCPGARENLVDLGALWDKKRLRESENIIAELNKQKANCYTRAYKWLSGALDMCEVIKGISCREVLWDRLDEIAEKIAAKLPRGESFSMSTAIISAVSGGAEVRLCNLYESAEQRYIIRDRYMTAHLLLERLVSAARKRKLPITVSRDAVDADRLDGVLIPSASISLIVSGMDARKGDETVFMSECLGEIDAVKESELLRAEGCFRSMISAARAALAEASSYHMELEKIYSAAMDFSGLDDVFSKLAGEIFGG